jgi:hypothetical protein
MPRLLVAACLVLALAAAGCNNRPAAQSPAKPADAPPRDQKPIVN